MAKSRKNQGALIRFVPAFKALFLCMLIAGSAIGYVWQKSRIYELGVQIRTNETQLAQVRGENRRLAGQLAILRSPVMLDERVREMDPGLAPAQPTQVWRLPEPGSGAAADGRPVEMAGR
ncbi:MAG: hypothetical protein KGR98_00080 [Verrucomicrobia bacterium]|nr:hypothetical protein [Verrucomicrobiota bacterium]MDE3099369.1 hypothetical protein [Verrucomicrobiota bacterium]